MNDKYSSAEFESEEMPSMTTIQRYVRGEMDADERDRMEASIADDPFLADAVEGYRLTLGDPQLQDRLSRMRHRVQASVDALPEPVTTTSRRQGRVKPFPQYLTYAAVAAGFALLLVFVGLLRNTDSQAPAEEQQIAQQELPVTEPQGSTQDENTDIPTPPPPPPPVEEPAVATAEPQREERSAQPVPAEPIPQADSMVAVPAPAGEALFDADGVSDDLAEVSEDPEAEINNYGPSPAAVPPAASGQTTAQESNSTSPPSPRTGNAAPTPSVELEEPEPAFTDDELEELREQAVQATTPVVREPSEENQMREEPADRRNRYQEESTLQADFEPNDIPPQDEADQEMGRMSKVGTITDLLQYALDLIDRNEPDSAGIVLDEVLLSEPSNVVANYLKGQTLMDLGQPQEAIGYLEQALDVEHSGTFEPARRLLVDAYLEAGRERKARILLREIAEEAGPFQQEAIQLLENQD